MLDDPILIRPDSPSRDGRGVRFVCGFLFGFLVGFLVVFRFSPFAFGSMLAGALVGAFVVGILSAWKGDRFRFILMGSLWR